MDNTAIIIFILISAALFILLSRQFKNIQGKGRPTSLTKEDIILGYEKLVRDLIEKNENEPKEILMEKKSQLLKHISKDLHNNIFFDENEAKEIVRKLAQI